jgi:hypothetical protein
MIPYAGVDPSGRGLLGVGGVPGFCSLNTHSLNDDQKKKKTLETLPFVPWEEEEQI